MVPGQVQLDASIQYGAPGIRSNMSLLQSVRKANPSAHIIYKPHPDVVAGLRKKGEGEDEAVHLCHEVVIDTVMGELLTVVDEVHVLTSLAGFEALLRGKTDLLRPTILCRVGADPRSRAAHTPHRPFDYR